MGWEGDGGEEGGDGEGWEVGSDGRWILTSKDNHHGAYHGCCMPESAEVAGRGGAG